jgi:steroid 5-alpha reductase family enzyme
LFTVFGLQGALMWIISLPIQVGISQDQDWHPARAIGLLLWIAGLFFETVGDFQLARFKADPQNQGRVMNRGLWRYTRHPNYFGDFLVWWGFYFVAAESGSWWWTIIGPLLMSFLLIRVSGVRLLESSLRSRVAGYEDYVRDTSAFFPLPPKQSSSPE